MKIKKETYYNIETLLSKKADYNMLLGQRSNGKSYAVKKMALWEAYHESDYYEFTVNKKAVHKERCEFGYLRRWGEDIKGKEVEMYFSDMPIEQITDGEYSGIQVFRGEIFFTSLDDDDKPVRGKRCGKTFSLNATTHYKSLSFPRIGNIIFEEFVTDTGYLPKEVDNLFDVVSTISRRDFVRVFLIGNTISRLCPYFDEWELTHVMEQKQGTIDIYKQPTEMEDEDGNSVCVTIAVEYCANISGTGKMFFGQKSKMINTGVWESQVYPHLPQPFNSYKCHYKILYKYNSFAFVINVLTGEDRQPFLFVYPRKNVSIENRKDIKRVISGDYSVDRMVTPFLTEVTKYDTLVMKLVGENRIVFSDNLTGTEFMQIKKERGRF